MKEIDLLDKLINQRRSIRRFLDKKVSTEIQTQFIQAAIEVPSATNSNPLRIVSYDSQQARKNLAISIEKGFSLLIQKAKSEGDRRFERRLKFFHRFSLPMLNSPLLWAIYSKSNDRFEISQTLSTMMNHKEVVRTNEDLSLGASLQNIALKAQSLGLGSCLYSAPLSFLSASNWSELPKCFIAIGYSDEDGVRPKKPQSGEIFKRI